MTLYNPIRDASGVPGGLQTDSNAYVFGLFFTVSAPAFINGIWWFVALTGGQYINSGADEQIALWTVSGLHAGTYVSGSVVTAGTYTTGWNLISFASPIALAANIEYCAVKGISTASSSKSYTSAAGFFDTANHGAGFSEGPVLVYSSGASPTGSSNLEPFGNFQQSFFAGSVTSVPPDVTTTFVNTGFSSSWYGMDVQIQSGAQTITMYSMRLS